MDRTDRTAPRTRHGDGHDHARDFEGKRRNGKFDKGGPVSPSVVRFNDLQTIYQRQRSGTTARLRFENFEEIPHLPAPLIASLQTHGITRPTDIQGALLAHFFATTTSDLLVKSRTGSGKSLGYVVLLLSLLVAEGSQMTRMAKMIPSRAVAQDKMRLRHLVLVPSELLARQLHDWIERLAPPSVRSNPLVHSIVSADAPDSEHTGDASPQIVIATPEALRIKFAQGRMDLSELRTIIIDEADALVKPLKRHATLQKRKSRSKHPVSVLLLLTEMLKSIAGDRLAERPRLIVASATLNRQTRDQLVDVGIVRAPVFIEDTVHLVSKRENLEPQHASVSHRHLLLSDPDNVVQLVAHLKRIVAAHLGDDASGDMTGHPTATAGARGVIFLPAEQSKTGLCQLLRSSVNFSVGLLSEHALHPTSPPPSVLVGSDVDCRGLDIPSLEFVVILDLPKSLDHYIHMAGRVGRMNRHGTVYTVLGTTQDFARFSSLMLQMRLTTIPAGA